MKCEWPNSLIVASTMAPKRIDSPADFLDVFLAKPNSNALASCALLRFTSVVQSGSSLSSNAGRSSTALRRGLYPIPSTGRVDRRPFVSHKQRLERLVHRRGLADDTKPAHGWTSVVRGIRFLAATWPGCPPLLLPNEAELSWLLPRKMTIPYKPGHV